MGEKRKIVFKVTLLTIGVLSIALGIIGIFLPVLPTTPFLLLASWCFLKSSPKAHKWLHQHPRLGPGIKAWEKSGAINPRAKAIAIILISISLGIILSKSTLANLHIPLTIILIGAGTFILTRPNQ